MDKKIKTEWDLKAFYKSINDPAIDRDILRAEKAFDKFEKKYRKIPGKLMISKKHSKIIFGEFLLLEKMQKKLLIKF